MTQHSSILEAFVKLGTFFRDYLETKKKGHEVFSPIYIELDEIITAAKHHNGWFTIVSGTDC